MDGQKRILLIGGVALVKGRVRLAGPVMVEICDEWEPELKRARFTQSAPFDTVSLVIRFGTNDSEKAEVGTIDRRNRELQVAYELPMEQLREASKEQLKCMFRRATLSSLQAVAAAYQLSLPNLNLKD